MTPFIVIGGGLQYRSKLPQTYLLILLKSTFSIVKDWKYKNVNNITH